MANVFGAGNPSDSHPDPGGDYCYGGNCGGVAPVEITLNGATSITLSATGLTNPWSLSGPGVCGPDGCTGNGNTNISAYTPNHISGAFMSNDVMYLAGVFWGPSLSSTPANWDGVSDPVLGQIFKIGSSGTFNVAAGATALYLGFVDAYGFSGNPGYYSDNYGSLNVDYRLSSAATPEPASLVLFSSGLASLVGFWRKRSK